MNFKFGNFSAWKKPTFGFHVEYMLWTWSTTSEEVASTTIYSLDGLVIQVGKDTIEPFESISYSSLIKVPFGASPLIQSFSTLAS
jgi:hypothetical protein